MPEAPSGLRAIATIRPSLRREMTNLISWRCPDERLQPEAGVSAAKERGTGSSCAQSPPEWPGHHPVREDTARRLLRCGRSRRRLRELPAALAGPEPHLWGVLRSGRGLTAVEAVARAGTGPPAGRQGPAAAGQTDSPSASPATRDP